MDYSSYFWQGKSVRLRPLQVEDAVGAYVDSLDSPTRQLLQLGIELPTSVAKLETVLEKYAGCKDVDGVVIFGIENSDGEMVGGTSLHTRNPKNGTFSFGINISRLYRKKGYADDAVRLLLKYAFHERRFQKCNSGCVEANAGSIALHSKLGFVEEGKRRRQWFMNGRFYDEILFGLTREEFDANQE